MVKRFVFVILGVALLLGLVMLSKSLNSTLADKGMKFLSDLNKTPDIVVLDDFEIAERDFGWETNGYVYLKQSAQHIKNGKSSCQATFTIFSDFESSLEKKSFPDTPVYYESLSSTAVAGASLSATGSTLSLKATDKNNGQKVDQGGSWIPTMYIGVQTKTPLVLSDWIKYKYFEIDAFNPQTKDENIKVTIMDIDGYEIAQTFSLPGGKDQTIKVALDLLKEKRMDFRRIKSISLALDTTHEEKDVVLYFDYIRLTLN